jgi:plastocyanin
MKTNKLTTGAFVLVLAACEGEPPKTPATLALPVVPPTAAMAEEPAAEPAAAPVPGALCPCACNCAGAMAANADGGAPDGGGPTATAVAATPPPATRVTISGDVTSTAKAAAANAVVYLDGAPIESTAKMTTTVTNHLMNFVPFVSVVPVGGKVVFANDDPFPHNVFSTDGERFNIGVLPPHEARARVFKNAGAYALLCNLHPGMLGYAVIVPSSYFGKADAHGHFSIKNVPSGTYKITAWAPRVQPVTQSVTVNEGDASVTFELHR